MTLSFQVETCKVENDHRDPNLVLSKKNGWIIVWRPWSKHNQKRLSINRVTKEVKFFQIGIVARIQALKGWIVHNSLGMFADKQYPGPRWYRERSPSVKDSDGKVESARQAYLDHAQKELSKWLADQSKR
jgi:hypothetical protein